MQAELAEGSGWLPGCSGSTLFLSSLFRGLCYSSFAKLLLARSMRNPNLPNSTFVLGKHVTGALGKQGAFPFFHLVYVA